MGTKTDKVTLRETWRLHWRACRLIHGLCPGLFAITALHAIAIALTPYVTIFFSARIINELASLRRPEELIRLVTAALLSMGA